MNRQKAQQLLEAYESPQIKVKGSKTIITFARQTEEHIKKIEEASDEALVQDWKSLVFINLIYGQVSLNELQRIALIELEFDVREHIKNEDLRVWYKKETEAFENGEYEF